MDFGVFNLTADENMEILTQLFLLGEQKNEKNYWKTFVAVGYADGFGRSDDR